MGADGALNSRNEVWIGEEVHTGPVLIESASQRVPQRRRWGWIESAVLAGYAVVVALGIAWHEPWADEAQAWLIARSMGWWRMMFHGVRYEGSPGLWHTFCWILIRLHIGFAGMHWAAGVAAVAAVAVLLRYSPFPLGLRVLLPFGFWLAYQDAVVARSYVLFAVLAFPAAAILRAVAQNQERSASRARLAGLALLLGLMANLSVHGFVISIGLAVVAAVLLRRRSRAGNRTGAAMPAALLCCFWIFAVVTTFPPSNVSFVAGKNFQRSKEKVLAALGDREAKLALAQNRVMHPLTLPGELKEWTPPPPHWTPAEARWHKVARVLSLFTYPVSNHRVLALLLCILVIAQALVFRAWPAARGEGQAGWIGLVPWLLMILFFTSMYMAPRHAGMLWSALLVTLWLTWPAASPADKKARWLHRVTVAVLVVVALDQVWWTAHSVWGDIHQPYSGDVAMAQLLREEGSGKRIAGFYYYTVGVNAWFGHNIFFNQPSAYWQWKTNVRVDQRAPMTIASHPDIIVLGLMSWGKRDSSILVDWAASKRRKTPYPPGDVFGITPYAESRGYRITHRFCGHAFMRAAYAEDLCMEALEPDR